MVIQIALKTEAKGYCNINELTEFPVMFPFEYTVSTEQLIADDHLTVTNFGGELTVRLK